MTNQDRLEIVAPRCSRAADWLSLRTRAVLCALVCLPVLLAASGAWTQSSRFNLEAARATLLAVDQAATAQRDPQDDPVGALSDFARTLSGSVSDQGGAPQPRAGGHDGGAGYEPGLQPLLDYLNQLGGEQPKPIGADLPQGHPAIGRDDAVSPLIAFAQQINSGEPTIKLAEAKKPKAVKAPAKAPADAEASFVGSQVCMGCHASHAAAFAQTVMGRIFRNPRTPQEKGGCETCHGAGSLHVKAGGGRGVGGIISFRKDDTSRPVADNNAICLSCHDKGQRINWPGSTHESRDLACTNCHTVMTNVSRKSQLKTVNEIDTCFQCHKNKRAEIWRSSHMPIREGKMTCSSCHNPHGSFSESLLKEATVNDTCYKCHAEKRGPFLFEHAPVRENCLNCHDPHGSNNDFLLKISRPRLCQQCHATLTGHPANPRNPMSVYALNRECQNCHSQHHGSNSPSGARFQR